MSKFVKRPVCTFKAESIIGNFITQSYMIVNEMSGSAYFTTPPIPYLSVKGHIEDLQTAETLAKTRAIGLAAQRDIKYDDVLKDLHRYQSYVETMADNADDYLTGCAIIKASGFKLKNSSAFMKPPLRAKQGVASGEVKLYAQMAAKRATYYWQISLDEGANYADLEDTLMAKATFSGLTTGVRAFFRYRARTKEGLGKWSVAVDIMVN